MKPATQRVITALADQGIFVEPTTFAESTRTAADAAIAIGTTVAQIVKSLVFLADDQPILVLTSGVNRVDVAALAAELGQVIARAPAERVREATGFAIGGVPPLAHATPLATYVDPSLLRFAVVWSAAGTPNSVFPIAPRDLVRVTNASQLPATVFPSLEA